MPLYSFQCTACENKQEVTRPMACEDPVLCEKCSFVMQRDFQTDFGKQHHGDTYPYASYAAGVSESEVPAMRKFDKEHGVPTEYKDGDPVMRSPQHRKAYLQAHNIFDRNAGYGDPVPARCR